MPRTGLACLAALAVATAVPLPVFADATVQVSGQAPLVCSAGVSAAPTVGAGASVSLGALVEFCNDPNGFDVWIDYPASLAHQRLTVDGRTIQLSDKGSVLVSHFSRPSQASLSLAISGPLAPGPVPLTIRMVPA